MFTLWHRWLQVSQILLILFGLLFAFLGTSSALSPMTHPILSAFWVGGEIPENSREFAFFSFGLMGALSAALGELGWFVARYGIGQRQKWAWNGLLAAVVLWYLIDGFVSIYAGVAINVAFNTVFLLMIVVPLIGLRSHMVEGDREGVPATA